jgi:hypothetical protein
MSKFGVSTVVNCTFYGYKIGNIWSYTNEFFEHLMWHEEEKLRSGEHAKTGLVNIVYETEENPKGWKEHIIRMPLP